MSYLLASAPIATVLALMLGFRWGAHKAGAAGMIAATCAGFVAFGLTPGILWISQAKGFLLSVYVLGILWPALFLFHWLNGLGGIESAARELRTMFPDPGMCAMLMSWCLSGCFEGVAGFGLPVAIVSPMLVAVGVTPIRAVAAVAVGHSWAVTFGSMGVIFQTLIAITGLPPTQLVPWSALLLGLSCVGCGIAVSGILRSAAATSGDSATPAGTGWNSAARWWLRILFIGATMAGAQFVLCSFGLTSLGSFGGGLAGLLAFRLFVPRRTANGSTHPKARNGLRTALCCYGALAAALACLALLPQLRTRAETLAWRPCFAETKTRTGFATAAGGGPAFRPLVHPGFLTVVVAAVAVGFRFKRSPDQARHMCRTAMRETLCSGGLASLGVLFMVGLAAVMDHCGMTLLLAEAAVKGAGRAYPLLSPFIGALGAFATGSNNNSNIMFASLQRNAATLLHVSPAIILSAQTAGGALGSMVAPAKLVIGCSTAGLAGQEGLVLRRTLKPLLLIASAAGLATLLLVHL